MLCFSVRWHHTTNYLCKSFSLDQINSLERGDDSKHEKTEISKQPNRYKSFFLTIGESLVCGEIEPVTGQPLVNLEEKSQKDRF